MIKPITKQTMNYFFKNIEHLRISRKLDIKEMLPVLKRSYSTVHNYFNGKTEPSFEIIESFCLFFDVSVADLMGRDLTKHEPLFTYKNRAEETQAKYVRINKTAPIISASTKTNIEISYENSIKDSDLDFTPIAKFMGRVDFFYKVTGDSMENESVESYQNGSFVSARVIKNVNNIQFGREYVIQASDNFFFARVDSSQEDGKLNLIYLNEKYKPQSIKKNDIISISLVTGKYQDK